MAEKGIHAFISENKLTMKKEVKKNCEVYRCKNLTLIRANVFDVDKELQQLRPINAVYDRGGLVAIDPSKR